MKRKDKTEDANKYFLDVLNGHCIVITPKCVWAKEFVKLCKKCKDKKIYRNFSPANELCGEYSIYKTNERDEIKVNEL